MKRTIILIGIMLIGISANSQTALYKKYANSQGVRAYCVERYPLAVGDSVTVTFFEVEDTATYQFLYKELKSMPYSHGSANSCNSMSTKTEKRPTQNASI